MYGINYVNILRHLNAKVKRVMNSYNKGHIQNDAVDELAVHIFSDIDANVVLVMTLNIVACAIVG